MKNRVPEIFEPIGLLGKGWEQETLLLNIMFQTRTLIP